MILPSPSVSSFFIKASHFFLLMAWLILPSSAVVMYPELSLSIACSNNNHVVSPRGLEVTLKARTALSRCSVLLCWSTCSFRTSDLTLHLSFILIYLTQNIRVYLFAKLRNASLSMKPDSFVILFNLLKYICISVILVHNSIDVFI